MYIASKEAGIILNFDNIVELYTGSDGTAVVAKQLDGKVIRVQEYESRKEAREAIAMIANGIRGDNIVYIPDRETVNGHIVNSGAHDRARPEGGKKAKGYGGS